MNKFFSGTQPSYWPKYSWLRKSFIFAFYGSDFRPNFLFNIQKLHDDLCRYHIPIDVFSSSIRSKEEDLLALWCVVVFIFCFPRGHDTLSDMRSCALISGGHTSPLSFSLGQKFSIPLASSRDYQCGFLGISFFQTDTESFLFDALLTANWIFLSISLAMTSNCSKPFACYLLCLRSTTCLAKYSNYSNWSWSIVYICWGEYSYTQ